MTKNPLSRFSTRITAQNEPIAGSEQTANSAGGFAWAVDDWSRLHRFLILGVDGGSYYATERQLVKQNAECVLECIALNGARTVQEIVAVSEAGRNPKHHPVIFALAACCASDDPVVRKLALDSLARVCRTGTHLFLFVGYVEQFRGWGRGLRGAVARWYTERDPDDLAFQLIKYQQREGWSQRDVLRLAKPSPVRDSPTDLAIAWAVGKLDDAQPEATPRIIRAHIASKSASSPGDTARLIEAEGLPWEAVSAEHLGSPEVWRALVPTMGLGALVRNLGRMTANGTLGTGNAPVDTVVARLADAGQMRRSRLHPIQILSALLSYSAGRGVRGKLVWEPVTAVIDALDSAFYASFSNVEPSGTRTLVALDVSGSMCAGVVAGVPGLTPRVASAAMAALTLATEPEVETVAFSAEGRGAWKSPTQSRLWRQLTNGIAPLNLSKRQRLDDIVETVSGLRFGGTDCALPMLYALDRGIDVDTFVIYTDSETWAGDIHPAQALRRYRERTGIPARLVVVAMVSNGFSIADPDDPGMLDVVGFDTAAPQLIADFASGRI